MSVTALEVVNLFFFSVQVYHLVAHLLILTGLRSLPRRDLSGSRYYFLAECLTMTVCAFILTERFLWIATVHILVHFLYVITWDKSYMAKNIIDWSCLDRYSEKNTAVILPVQLDSTFITSFDCLGHAVMLYSIGQHLHWTGHLLGTLLAGAALNALIFNPKYAWSHPKNMPAWVQKRLSDLALKYD